MFARACKKKNTFQKERVQIINNKRKKFKKRKLKCILLHSPTPEKAFGHNQQPIPNRELENKFKKVNVIS